MKKKLISLLTAFSMTLMLFTGVPISVSAEKPTSGTCGTNLKWSLENGVLTISGAGNMFKYNNQSDAPWYDNRSTIKSIIMEDGVTSIGYYAFSGCSNLTSIEITNDYCARK